MADGTEEIIELDASATDGAQESAPLTVEQVQDAVDKAIESHSDDDSKVQQQIADSAQGLHDDIGVLNAKLDAIKSTGGESGVVVIDSSQWDTVARCWGWAKTGASMALFLALVMCCLLAANLGAHLWSIFGEGWRK